MRPKPDRMRRKTSADSCVIMTTELPFDERNQDLVPAWHSMTHRHPLSASLSFSLSLSHTHTQHHSLSLSHTHTHILHTHTNTHIHTHTVHYLPTILRCSQSLQNIHY